MGSRDSDSMKSSDDIKTREKRVEAKEKELESRIYILFKYFLFV